MILSIATVGLLVAGCGAGDAGVKHDGLHETTAPPLDTDVSDTAGYRIRNENQDVERGDSLKKMTGDTAKIDVDQNYR